MSLFEWFGESMNPGPIGGVDVGGRDRAERSRGGAIACFVIAGALLGFWLSVVWSAGPVAILGTAIYLVLAYFVHPSPDLSNIGWAGGLFDHPFRYSDDVNRFLVFLVVVLWPGRFVAESLVGMGRLLAREWHS